MLLSEFLGKTGFEPTTDEYEKIESAYYNYKGDKNQFCKDFVKKGGIAHFAKKRLMLITILEQQLDEKNTELQKLEKQLEDEQEWRPADKGTNMDQEEYSRLKEIGNVLTVAEAKEFILKACAFEPHSIQIKSTAALLEKNRHNKYREINHYDRIPIYADEGHNYIRFDTGDNQYEMINGNFYFYDRSVNQKGQ